MKYSQDFSLDFFKLQSLIKKNIYFDYQISNMDRTCKKTLLDFANIMNENPVKFLNKYNSLFLNRLNDWLIIILSNFKQSADVIGNYFLNNPENLELFGTVTFPSIFNFFLSEEFSNIGLKFVKRIAKKFPMKISKVFITAFLRVTPIFFQSLWSYFDIIAIENYKKHTDNGLVFQIFLKVLKITTSSLSKNEFICLRLLKEKSIDDFSEIFFGNLLIPSHLLYYSNHFHSNESKMILNILQFIQKNTKSSQFLMLTSVLFNNQYYRFVNKCYNNLDKTISMIFTIEEIIVIQNIVNNNTKFFNLSYFHNTITPKENDNYRLYFFDFDVKHVFKQNNQIDKNFMFNGLKENFSENNEFEKSWSKLSLLSKMYNTTEINLLKKTGLPLKEIHILDQIPFLNDKKFHEYVELISRNRIIQSLNSFESFISNETIHKSINELINQYETKSKQILTYFISQCYKKKDIQIQKSQQSLKNQEFTIENPSSNIKNESNEKIVGSPNTKKRHSTIYKSNFKKSIDILLKELKNNTNCNITLKPYIFVNYFDRNISHDSQITLLKNEFDNLLSGFKLKNFNINIPEEYKSKYFNRLVYNLSHFYKSKFGKNIIIFIDSAVFYHLLCKKLYMKYESKRFKASSIRLLKHCLLQLTSNEFFYSLFFIEQKSIFLIESFKNIATTQQNAIIFFQSNFWKIIKELDPNFYLNSRYLNNLK